MGPRAAALVLVIAALFPLPGHRAAHAGIIQTGCDTLATDPPTVRFTFAVVNDCVVDINDIRFLRDPGCRTGGDSCCVLECAGPQNWVCRADPVHDGGAMWTATPYPN